MSRVDAFDLDPPRIVAALALDSISICACAFDARLFSKRRNYLFASVTIVACFGYWIAILMWYSGHWLQVFQRTIQLENNQIDLMSTAMSSFTTATILMSRFAWTLVVSKEINQCCMLHGRVAYRVKT